MKYVTWYLSKLWVCSLFSILCVPQAFSADSSCECPKLACDPCSVEQGITFFTDKCGPSNSRVKSCARPTCVPLDVATNECPVPPGAKSGAREPLVLDKTGGIAKESAAATFQESMPIGKVKVLSGSVSIVRVDGKKIVVQGDADLHETDRIESDDTSAALVNFDGGNQLHVLPSTTVQVEEYQNPQVNASRKALFNLIKGKIRNQVKQKYDGTTSYYRVKTKAAVAGVRGTDFLIEHNEGNHLETKVETLGGIVRLASLDDKQAVQLERGEGSSFTSDIPGSSLSEEDALKFIQRGKLSPVYKIPKARLKELNRDTLAGNAVKFSKQGTNESAICEAPRALLDQCVWRCVGNPAGESSCRADLA